MRLARGFLMLWMGAAGGLFAQPSQPVDTGSAEIYKVSVGTYLTALYDVDPSSQSYLADMYV